MHKLPNKKIVYVFDNDGKTFDQYTILTSDGDIFGCSYNPFSPQGVGNFSHNLMDKYTRFSNGKKLNKKFHTFNLKREIKAYRFDARTNPDGIGKELKGAKAYAGLPEPVRQYILQVTENDINPVSLKFIKYPDNPKAAKRKVVQLSINDPKHN
jgi:hypothetical protein